MIDLATAIAEQTGRNLGDVREDLRREAGSVGIITVDKRVVEIFNGADVTRRIIEQREEEKKKNQPPS